MWFRAGADSPAVNQLISILDRAPFDGLADGPQLAAQVREAQARARSGQPNDIATADRILSAAWVAYVQRMKSTTPGNASIVTGNTGGQTQVAITSASERPSDCTGA